MRVFSRESVRGLAAYFESLAKEIRTKQAIGQASAEGENQSE